MHATSRREFLSSSAAAVAASWWGRSASAGERPAGEDASVLGDIPREKLKITDIRVTLLSCEFPAEKRWLTAEMICWKSDAVLVQVFTDRGIVGMGESSPYGGPEQIKEFIEGRIRPALLGKNPFDVEQLSASPETAARGQRVAWAGVDAALWDIVGKATGRPVYELLAAAGAPDPHIPIYASGGVEYAWYGRPDDLIDEAVRHKENGYTAFKFRIGTSWKHAEMTVAKYIPYLERMRRAVGPDFRLIQEVNMRLDLEQVLELCPVLEELKFLWLEEPISRQGEKALEGYLRINQALPHVLVSGGESMASRAEFKEWIDRDAYDIVQPDCNSTGVTGAWRIARMAHRRGKSCCPHNWHGGLTTMANASLVAAIPNRFLLELNQTWNPLKEEVFKDPLVVKRGFMDLPRKPGFGLDLADGLAKRFPYIPGTYHRPNPALTGGSPQAAEGTNTPRCA